MKSTSYSMFLLSSKCNSYQLSSVVLTFAWNRHQVSLHVREQSLFIITVPLTCEHDVLDVFVCIWNMILSFHHLNPTFHNYFDNWPYEINYFVFGVSC